MDKAALLRDPIFQVNALIWMLLPNAGDSSWRPVLNNLGYSLFSISQDLRFTPSAQKTVFSLVGNTKPPCADVIAQPAIGAPWLVFECKASPFSDQSENVNQLKKYLVSTGTIAGALGLLNADDHVSELVYLLGASDSGMLIDTIRKTIDDISEVGSIGKDVTVLELDVTEDGIGVRFGATTASETALNALVPLKVFLTFEEGEDPRPLYYIPWDPDVDQSVEAAIEGKQELVQRCIMAAISRIQRHNEVGYLDLDASDLIAESTNGLSKKWRNKSAIRTMSTLVIQAIAERLSRSKKIAVSFSNLGTHMSIRVGDREMRTKICDILLRGEIDASEDPLVDIQQNLFDH